MKNKKLIFTLILSFTLVFFIVFSKVAWKHLGFKMMTDPSMVVCEVSEENNQIVIKGTTAKSIGTFEGYYKEVIGDTLFIGVHYSLIGNNGAFYIKQNQVLGKINKVVLKKGEIEKEIWRR